LSLAYGLSYATKDYGLERFPSRFSGFPVARRFPSAARFMRDY
jgi:hypothetical protein